MQVNKLRILSLGVVLAVAGAASAQTFLSYTTAGSLYTQNFDSMANTGSGNAWNNNAPVPLILTGWSAFRSGSTGITGARDSTLSGATSYGADAGTATSGGLFSFGSSGTTERAWGTQNTNGTGDWLTMFAVRNDTTKVLTSFTLLWGETRDRPPAPASLRPRKP